MTFQAVSTLLIFCLKKIQQVYSPKTKCFVLGKPLSTKDDRKRRLFWGKIKPEPTVVRKILSSGVLGHSGAEMFRHVLSEVPKTHKQLGRWVSMLSICHMDPQSFINLHYKQQAYLYGNSVNTQA